MCKYFKNPSTKVLARITATLGVALGLGASACAMAESAGPQPFNQQNTALVSDTETLSAFPGPVMVPLLRTVSPLPRREGTGVPRNGPTTRRMSRHGLAEVRHQRVALPDYASTSI
jgi:hypothetical protein